MDALHETVPGGWGWRASPISHGHGRACASVGRAGPARVWTRLGRDLVASRLRPNSHARGPWMHVLARSQNGSP
eukprot:4875477-Pyramimonas_sp.AAC.1